LGLNVKPVPDSAAVVSALLESHDLHDVTILAHSKGGLIGKHAMASQAGLQRVKGMVAVATPFAGSIYAKYMLAPSLKIFSPRDANLRALASDEAANARIVSVYGAFDPHIPARSALTGAKNVELETGGHFRILTKPQVLEEVSLLADSRKP
jgi:pimeloyl-ACP methyl ester carboxylesterase